MEIEKVDVVINVYGKPWQTLCTLKSLEKHSKKWINKIFFIKEREQPYSDSVDWVPSYFKDIIVHVPGIYRFLLQNIDVTNDSERLSARYQYGIEKSEMKYALLIHNDVLFTADIIGDMLEKIGDAVGIGELGQCWNCPANKMNYCDPDRFYEWNPSYEDIKSLPLPYKRTSIDKIDKQQPMPLPECRLNEWAALINREIVMKEAMPSGSAHLFGDHSGVDTGSAWFRDMHMMGYKFVHYRDSFVHAYWSYKSTGLPNGYQVQKDRDKYVLAEDFAKKYFEQHFA